MENQQPLVAARNLSKRYGDVAVLNDVNFEIHKGITGVLGSNGAGKTTVLGMILGLHHRTGGQLGVLGVDPWTAGTKVREQIGYAPEHHTLSPELPAAEFVQLVAELHGLPKADAITRSSDALTVVGLGEERFRPMGTMSTGQRQRVKLAQAIAHHPKLVILDEPTDGLDPGQRDNVLELIKTISTEFEMSVILSSHLIDEVDRVCDSVVIIGEGRTLASGSIEHLKNRSEQNISLELAPGTTNAAEVVAALRSQSTITAVAAESLRLTITFSSDDAFDQIRDVCAQTDAGIMSLGQKSLSLEDVFLESMQ